MKIFSLDGKGTGKVGGSVYYVNRGVQVRRQYTAAVTNPNTVAQVGQRSRFKLASQVSASLADVIAIPRKGIVSPRNAFVKLNMPYFYADYDGAFVSFDSLQITRGNIGLPAVTVSRGNVAGLRLSLAQAVSPSISHVVYNVFNVLDGGILTFAASTVVDVQNERSYAPADIENVSGALVVYAYGFSLTNAKAFAKYGRYSVSSGLDIARLVSSRVLDKNDIRFSVTSGLFLSADQESGGYVSPGSWWLQVRTNSLGAVIIATENMEGYETTSDSLEIENNTIVTLEAVSAGNHTFLGWFNNGEQTPFSTDTTIEFAMTEPRFIIARWAQAGGLE